MSGCNLLRLRSSHSLVRTVDILHVQDGQVPIISEVSKGNAGAGLDLGLVEDLLRHIESDGHGEDVAVGQTGILDDSSELHVSEKTSSLYPHYAQLRAQLP